ncbi:MAG: redox-regulated ATPase YchF [Candidatus Marinimicrobia bacterium]|nr:redox-regulated ATPase YchF [Candidatus Neomarinimicrobiota bacterium]
MQVGIIGLPFSGKTTIFSTLLKHKVSNAYKSRKKTEKGVVKVPDERLDKLSELYQPGKKTNATVEYIKVPGFDQKDEKPKALPGEFISNLKTVDTILMVVRAFENELAPHPMQRINPQADIEFMNSEMLLSDLTIIEKRMERIEKELRINKDEKKKLEMEVLEKCYDFLIQEKPLREMQIATHEEKILRNFQFLTLKPILYVINIDEAEITRSNAIIAEFEDYQTDSTAVTALCAEIEKEISDLDNDDQNLFIDELGIEEPALHNLIRNSYELLGLISYFTVGEDECRAWTIRNGSTAKQAGGAIHSDIERGFIRAKVTAYHDLLSQGGLRKCKERGLLRQESKEYSVQDGDVMEFQFNV